MPDVEKDAALLKLLNEHEEFYPHGCTCEGYVPTSLDVFRHRDQWREHRDALVLAWLAAVLHEAYDAGREHGGIETRQDAADWSFENWWENR